MQALIAKEKYESRQLLRNYSSMNNLVEQHLAIKVAESSAIKVAESSAIKVAELSAVPQNILASFDENNAGLDFNILINLFNSKKENRHLELNLLVNSFLYCYGLDGEPCSFERRSLLATSPSTSLEIFSDRAIIHAFSCCISCCRKSKSYGLCPCDLCCTRHLSLTSGSYCFGTEKHSSCVIFNVTNPQLLISHFEDVCLECSKDWNGGDFCLCSSCVATVYQKPNLQIKILLFVTGQKCFIVLHSIQLLEFENQ